MIDTSKFQLHPDFQSDDEEETPLLLAMAERALAYIRGFRWCPPIKRIYLAYGVGDLFALFLVQFERPIANGKDKDLWVAVGDLPSAYFVTDAAPDPVEAVDTYCELMEDWAEAVVTGQDLSEYFPVTAAPTPEHARMLKGRMEFIREKMMPDVVDMYPLSK